MSGVSRTSRGNDFTNCRTGKPNSSSRGYIPPSTFARSRACSARRRANSVFSIAPVYFGRPSPASTRAVSCKTVALIRNERCWPRYARRSRTLGIYASLRRTRPRRRITSMPTPRLIMPNAIPSAPPAPVSQQPGCFGFVIIAVPLSSRSPAVTGHDVGSAVTWDLVAHAAPQLAHAHLGLRRVRAARDRRHDVLEAQDAGPGRVVRRLHQAVAIAHDRRRAEVRAARPQLVRVVLAEAVDVWRVRELRPRRARPAAAQSFAR